MRSYYKTVEFNTQQINLHELEPKLVSHLQDYDFFHVTDLTEQSATWVNESGMKDGLLTVFVHHTTCILSINELDEPCLLGDINQHLRDEIPKNKSYLHNGPLRWKNLCEDDDKCDRNADAHIKSFLYGSPSQTMIIRSGKVVWGQWQRLCLVDFDGPRKRNISVQIIGD